MPTPAHYANGQPNQTQPGFSLEQTQWVPFMRPQRDRSEENQHGKAKYQGHSRFRPLPHAQPIAHDGPPWDEECEGRR
jgi:hypothetical protein